MEIDHEKLLENAIRDGLREGIKSKLTGYNDPLNKLLNDAITARTSQLRALLDEAIAACIEDPEFRQNIREATSKTLAKTLVQRFGGELEKQVNVLKSDPTTRARITLAIEEIVKQR